MNTKTSRTLRFLESHAVFTLEEFLAEADSTVSERTRYENLQNAVARDQAYRLKRGLYASNLGIYRDRAPNVLLVAAKSAPDAVISHHSALEASRVAHTPLRTVYFTSASRVADFSARGYRIQRASPPVDPGLGGMLSQYVTLVRAGEGLIPVTTKERTIVDCLRDLTLGGGLEELVRSAGGFTSVSLRALADYLALLGSPTLVARTGWLLDLFAEPWSLDADKVEALRGSLGKGTYQLARHSQKQRFVARWRLYVPDDMPFEAWARG